MVTNRRANYRGDEMDEVSQYRNDQAPQTSGRRGNYQEEDMDEGGNNRQMAYYDNSPNERAFETNHIDVQIEDENYLRDMDEKPKKDSSRVLAGEKQHPSITSALSNNKLITRGQVPPQEQRENNTGYEQDPGMRENRTQGYITDTYRGDAFNSRDMNE